MQVSLATIVLALHQVFDRHGVYSGGSLRLDRIEAAWGESGLRRRDLDEAITRLQRAGLVQLDLGLEGPALRLLSYDLPVEPADGTIATDAAVPQRHTRELSAARAALSAAQRRREPSAEDTQR